MKRIKLNFLAPVLPLILVLAACSSAPTPVAQVATQVPPTAAPPSATVGPTRTEGPTYTPLFPTFTPTVATATRSTPTSTITLAPSETLAPLFTATSTPASTATMTPTPMPTSGPTNIPTSTETPASQTAANPSVNPAYDQAVQADQPIGYWRLDETSGTTAFDTTSQGKHPGVYSGGYTLGTPPSAPGQFSSAPSFDGSGQVTVKGVLPTGSAARTVELWFNQSDNNYRELVNNGTGQGSWEIAIGGGLLGVSYAGNFYRSGTVAAPGYWHYVVVTYDGKNTLQIYLDGLPIYSPSDLTLNTISTDLFMAQHGITSGWLGSLANVAVYDHALSADRVAKHYAAWYPAQVLNPVGAAALSDYDRAILTAHPVDYWPLDSTSSDPQEASRQTLADLTNGYCPASFGGSDYKIGVAGALGQDKGVSFGGNSQINLCVRGMLPVQSSPRTVEMWFKSEAAGGRTMFVYGGEGDGHMWEFPEQSDSIGLHYWGAGAGARLPIPLDTWHYVAVTFDGTTSVQIYLDGKLVDSEAVRPLNTTWDYARIGGPGYTPSWIGSVDEVAVYDYVLTANTIADHYRLATNPPTVVF